MNHKEKENKRRSEEYNCEGRRCLTFSTAARVTPPEALLLFLYLAERREKGKKTYKYIYIYIYIFLIERVGGMRIVVISPSKGGVVFKGEKKKKKEPTKR